MACLASRQQTHQMQYAAPSGADSARIPCGRAYTTSGTAMRGPCHDPASRPVRYRVQGKPWRRKGNPDWRRSRRASARRSKGPPPVEQWNPPFCGDLDMRIAADGTWFYLKTPIGRPALVKLFASVLKREGDRYFLVTPVESAASWSTTRRFWRSSFDIERWRRGQVLQFPHQCRRLGGVRPRHPLRFEPQPAPAGSSPICTSAAICGRR